MSLGNPNKDDIVSANERKFIRDALSKDLRVDGRRINDFRSLQITFSKSPGSVQLQLGKTIVYSTCTAEIVQPYPERPTEGFFQLNVICSPIASPAHEEGRGKPEDIELIRVIERGIRQSNAIDTETLCIAAGEKVWKVTVNVNVLNDDGNIQDAAGIAAISSLRHFRRPAVSIDNEKVTVHSIEEKDPVPLSIHHTPISVTFGLFDIDGQDIICLDPSWKEEKVMDGKMTITLNPQKEICALQKSGGLPLDAMRILQATKIAQKHAQRIAKQLQIALKATGADSTIQNDIHFISAVSDDTGAYALESKPRTHFDATDNTPASMQTEQLSTGVAEIDLTGDNTPEKGGNLSEAIDLMDVDDDDDDDSDEEVVGTVKSEFA